jgi:toxin HigB-1
MEIRNIKHRGLKAFVEKGETKGLPPDRIRRISQIIGFLADMEDIGEVRSLRKWHAHMLTGERRGVHSLLVSGNWRITFLHDTEANEIYDLDLEDYH